MRIILYKICPVWKSDYLTVWKFHGFSITQNLLEINFGKSRNVKFAILTHSEALNFDLYEILTSEIYQLSQTRFKDPLRGSTVIVGQTQT